MERPKLFSASLVLAYLLELDSLSSGDLISLISWDVPTELGQALDSRILESRVPVVVAPGWEPRALGLSWPLGACFTGLTRYGTAAPVGPLGGSLQPAEVGQCVLPVPKSAIISVGTVYRRLGWGSIPIAPSGGAAGNTHISPGLGEGRNERPFVLQLCKQFCGRGGAVCRACPIQGPPWGPSQDSEGLGERQARSSGGGGVSYGAAGFSDMEDTLSQK